MFVFLLSYLSVRYDLRSWFILFEIPQLNALRLWDLIESAVWMRYFVMNLEVKSVLYFLVRWPGFRAFICFLL